MRLFFLIMYFVLLADEILLEVLRMHLHSGNQNDNRLVHFVGDDRSLQCSLMYRGYHRNLMRERHRRITAGKNRQDSGDGFLRHAERANRLEAALRGLKAKVANPIPLGSESPL